MTLARRLVSCLCAASVAAAGIARADDAEAPPKKKRSEDPPEIRVIGGKPDSLQRVPGSGQVVGSKEIERTEPKDVAEMLRRVPGVQVRQEEGAGGRLDIGVRGLDPGRSRRVLVLEDGIPVSINPYAEPDMYYAPPVERMRGIEVVKGSGSILFGPQTIGGVVNFLTLLPPNKRTATVDVQGGELGYAKVLASYGDAHGPVRYVVQAFEKRGDGIREQAFDSKDVMAKVAFDTSDQGETTVKIGVHDDVAFADDVGLTRDMFRADPRRPTLSPNSRLKLRRYEASVIHDQRFGASTKLRTLVYAYTTNRLWRRQDYTRSPVPGEYYERIVGDVALPRGAIYFKDSNTILDREYEVLGVEPRLEQRFTTGDVGHTLDVGARLLVETAHYELRKGEVPTSEAGSLELDERHRTIAIATYTQDRIAFRDDLLVTPGIRFESASYRRQLFRQSGQDVAPPARGDSSVASFVPGVGMIYGTRQAHVFGGIHLGFAPPRVTSAINPNGVDQKLDAERAILYELGTRASPVRWLRAEVTGFLSSFQNQVVAAQSDIGTELTNAGATRNVGVESGVTLQLARAAKLPLTVDLGARYTYVRATFVGGPNDGNLLPYAPEHSGGATLDVEHASGFGGQLGVVVVGAQYTDPLDTEAEDATGRVGKIPAYTIVDAGLRYRNAPTGLSARILVKNALDDVYLSSRRPEGIFASGFRQIILGIRWDYGRGP